MVYVFRLYSGFGRNIDHIETAVHVIYIYTSTLSSLLTCVRSSFSFNVLFEGRFGVGAGTAATWLPNRHLSPPATAVLWI